MRKAISRLLRKSLKTNTKHEPIDPAVGAVLTYQPDQQLLSSHVLSLWLIRCLLSHLSNIYRPHCTYWKLIRIRCHNSARISTHAEYNHPLRPRQATSTSIRLILRTRHLRTSPTSACSERAESWKTNGTNKRKGLNNSQMFNCNKGKCCQIR